MFGAGWTEMLIIGIVALVVIGPKDLPVVMRKLGRVVRTVQRMGQEFQSELSKTTGLDQITDLKRSITEPLRQSSDEIMREFNRQTSSGVEPTGIVKPTDPNVESVYDQIAATSGLPPATAASSASAEILPAPAEAAPAVKRRRPRKASAAASAPAANTPVAEIAGMPPSAPAQPAKPATAKAKPATTRARKSSAPAVVAPPVAAAASKRAPRPVAASTAPRQRSKKA